MRFSLRATSSDRGLKLAWSGDDWSPPHYYVRPETVRSASEQIRAVLDEMSEHFRTTYNPSYADFFPRLVEAGQVLGANIFQALNGGGNVSSEIRDVIYSPENAGSILSIYSDAKVHVPWGFVFSDRAEPPATLSNDIQDFSSFWSSIFQLSIRYCETSYFGRARNRSNFRILSAVHEELEQNALQLINQPKRDAFQRLRANNEHVATNWADCKKRWDKITNNDSVFYIFGHSNGTEISLAENPTSNHRIDAARFLTYFNKKPNTNSATLCFINGCRSGAGFLDNSFLSVTSGPGFHGFIGTEAQVNNKLATEYAIDFLNDLQEGYSVQEAFQRARKAFFPSSLLYSCFANPAFRIAKDEVSV